MTNINHAAEVVYDTLSGKYGDFCHHEEVARALADAGPLAAEPQVIRTREELAALDPDTVVTDGLLTTTAGLAALYAQIGMLGAPVVVIATGGQVRAARQALKDGE